MTKIDSLSRAQRRAIRSLLAKPTIALAAQDCGSSESALYRWLREDSFRAVLTEAESAAIDIAARRLVGLAEKAIGTIESVLDEPTLHPATRMRAAELVLSNMLRLVELVELEQRIAALEGRVNGYTG